jgi:hypothetical protein
MVLAFPQRLLNAMTLFTRHIYVACTGTGTPTGGDTQEVLFL